MREEVAAAAVEVGDLRDKEEARAASAAVHYRQEVSVFFRPFLNVLGTRVKIHRLE